MLDGPLYFFSVFSYVCRRPDKREHLEDMPPLYLPRKDHFSLFQRACLGINQLLMRGRSLAIIT